MSAVPVAIIAPAARSPRDAPEQNAVLNPRRHSEIRDDQRDDENIVQTQRFLDQVARDERDQRVAPVRFTTGPGLPSSHRCSYSP
jgi:hypothetical protein